MDDIRFYFNGKTSDEIGVYLVTMESGMKSTRFLAEREIISESIPSNPIPYVYGVQYQPLKFQLTLSCLDDIWTLDKRREVARWLDSPQFEEFYSFDNESLRYFFMYSGGIDLTYNGEKKGYITVEMVNISPWAYSPVYTQDFDCSANTVTDIEFINEGDYPLLPELEIYRVGAGDLSIVNLSNGGQEFKFTGLADAETIYIDNENRHIETDIPLTLRYDKFNHNYLELPRGVNRLKVTGKCRLSFRYRLIIKG